MGHNCVTGNITADDLTRDWAETAPISPESIEQVCKRDWTADWEIGKIGGMYAEQSLH